MGQDRWRNAQRVCAPRARGTRISREQLSLLGWSLELTNAADYELEATVLVAEAERAIEEDSRLMETIAILIGSA